MTSIFKTILATWTSRKLWMTLIACAILWTAYHVTTSWLYYYAANDLPNAKEGIAALSSMFSVMFYALAGIVAAYVGATGLIEMRQGSAVSSVIQSVSSASKSTISRDEKIIQEFAERYKDDPSYCPVENGEWR